MRLQAILHFDENRLRARECCVRGGADSPGLCAIKRKETAHSR